MMNSPSRRLRGAARRSRRVRQVRLWLTAGSGIAIVLTVALHGPLIVVVAFGAAAYLASRIKVR